MCHSNECLLLFTLTISSHAYISLYKKHANFGRSNSEKYGLNILSKVIIEVDFFFEGRRREKGWKESVKIVW